MLTKKTILVSMKAYRLTSSVYAAASALSLCALMRLLSNSSFLFWNSSKYESRFFAPNLGRSATTDGGFGNCKDKVAVEEGDGKMRVRVAVEWCCALRTANGLLPKNEDMRRFCYRFGFATSTASGGYSKDSATRDVNWRNYTEKWQQKRGQEHVATGGCICLR